MPQAWGFIDQSNLNDKQLKIKITEKLIARYHKRLRITYFHHFMNNLWCNRIKMWFVFVVAVLVESIMASNVSEVDVLILGAGITGIKAGNHFQNNNLTNFLILEAQDYIGGRIKQVTVGNVTVGEGANWVHYVEDKDDNPILVLANEINLEKYMNNEDDIAVK